MNPAILSIYTVPDTAAAQWSLQENELVCDHIEIPPAQLHGNVYYAIEQQCLQPFLVLAGGYVTFPVTPLMEVGQGDFSVCAWIRTTSPGISKILDKRIEGSGEVHGWSFFIYEGRINLQLSYPSPGTSWTNYGWWTDLSLLPFVNDDRWHHVAVTIDRDQTDGGRWYVDGKLVGRSFNPTGRQGSMSHRVPLTLGKRSDNGGGQFWGSIGGLRLYHWALTEAEVAVIYGEPPQALPLETTAEAVKKLPESFSAALDLSEALGSLQFLPQAPLNTVRISGVDLPRKYWIPTSEWQAQWLLETNNAELRRLLMQRIGYDRLCQELQATELDTWREYTLLKIDAKVDVEPIHLLKMTCPSTAHIHTLRVPPSLTSAREAIKWANWDVDPAAFASET